MFAPGTSLGSIVEVIIPFAAIYFAHSAKKRRFWPYRILRIILWFIWVYSGCMVIIALVVGGPSIEIENDAYLPEQLKGIDFNLLVSFIGYSIVFLLSTISYFMLISKPTIEFFKKRRFNAAEQIV